MPIYEYRCSACGFQKEYLQKMSDAPLTDCPECGKATLAKMVSAAGFQLKGSGWYVTDFRQGSKPAAGGAGKTAAKDEGAPAADKPAEAGAKSEPAAKSETAAATAPAASGGSTGAAAGSS